MSEGKEDQGVQGSNGRGCESADTRSDYMPSVAAAVADQGNCTLRSRWWENTVPAGTNSYLEWTEKTVARDASASARIG